MYENNDNMVTTIKKGSSKEEVQALLEQLIKDSSNRNGFDAKMYCGTVKFEEDALKIQKQLRNEWE